MAQTPKKWGFEPWLGNFSEPWLKVWFFGGLSHGSKSNNWCVRAMAQSPIIDEFEQWLKPPILRVWKFFWAMAQSPIFGGSSHGSKSNNFWSNKGSSILKFFSHFTLRFCNWVHQVCQFANLQKQKGIRLGSLFSKPISLVTLRSLFTISGQPKFLIPSLFYILPCTLPS